MRGALTRLACQARTRPKLAKSTPLLFHTTATWQAKTPTYSTRENMNFVTLTDPAMKTHLVRHGSLNAPLPKEYDLSLDEFIPLATSLVSLVTQSAASGKWEDVTGLLKPECARKLKMELEKLDPEQKKLVVLDPDDVLMKFVSNASDCNGGNDLHLVTFSFSGWCQISEVMEHFHNHLRALKKVKVSKDEFAEISKVVELQTDVNIQEILDSSEVVIGNYRLTRSHKEDNFSLTEVSQIAMDDPR